MRSDRRVCLRLLTMLAVMVGGVPAAARADWMVSAFLGHAWTLSNTVELTLPGQNTSLEIEDVEYRGESFRSPQYYTVRVSWIPDAHRWMAIEGEWIHAKAFAETSRTVRMQGTLRGAPIDASVPMSSLVQRLAMSHGLNFVLANFAVRREIGPLDPRGMARVVAVARAGVGPMTPHAESHIDNVPRDQYEYGGIGAQLGGGLEVSAWKGLAVVGDYKFTWGTPEIGVAGGEAKVPARSHHIAFGLGYRF